jgi:hypothetical protein
MASLGAIAGVLLTANALDDVSNAELETALHDIIHDLLKGHPE